VGNTLRYSALLRMEASWHRVFQFDLKIDGGAVRMVHVASTRMLRQGQVEDGWIDVMDYVRLCYPCFAIFFVLYTRDILFF
jgi:hypothetical protein